MLHGLSKVEARLLLLPRELVTGGKLNLLEVKDLLLVSESRTDMTAAVIESLEPR
jgi:hypothetical protein